MMQCGEFTKGNNKVQKMDDLGSGLNKISGKNYENPRFFEGVLPVYS
ncbi:hypothetical protein GCM10017717_22570 [Deinococcus persicinus]